MTSLFHKHIRIWGIFTKLRLSLWQQLQKTATIYLVILFATQQSFTVEIKMFPNAANM